MDIRAGFPPKHALPWFWSRGLTLDFMPAYNPADWPYAIVAVTTFARRLLCSGSRRLTSTHHRQTPTPKLPIVETRHMHPDSNDGTSYVLGRRRQHSRHLHLASSYKQLLYRNPTMRLNGGCGVSLGRRPSTTRPVRQRSTVCPRPIVPQTSESGLVGSQTQLMIMIKAGVYLRCCCGLA